MVSERWQQEVAETVFEAINIETDKIEQKRKQKPRIDDYDERCMFLVYLFYIISSLTPSCRQLMPLSIC